MKILLNVLLLLALDGMAQEISSLPAVAFEKRIKAEAPQLLDVRRAEEYKSGHIARAFQADWTDKKQFEERVQYLDKAAPVYIYCLSGGRSAAAAAWLAEKGFSTVVNLEGGMNAWRKAGMAVQSDTLVQQMTDAAYNGLLQSARLVLVDFGAEWCPPCKKMEPVWMDLQEQYNTVRLVKIDAGIQTDLMKRHGIQGLPVFILYKSGKEVWRHEGIAQKSDFEKVLKNHL